MVKLHLELAGEVEEVARVLCEIGGAAPGAIQGAVGLPIALPEGSAPEAASVSEPETATTTHAELPSGRWTAELAADFTARLNPVARRMAYEVWQAGEEGLHRNALYRRTEMTPVELRSLLMEMGRLLRRLQRERGTALSRPVAANTPLQMYFIDPDFAAVAESHMFGDEGGAGNPRMNRFT